MLSDFLAIMCHLAQFSSAQSGICLTERTNHMMEVALEVLRQNTTEFRTRGQSMEPDARRKRRAVSVRHVGMGPGLLRPLGVRATFRRPVRLRMAMARLRLSRPGFVEEIWPWFWFRPAKPFH